jgi:hypothetical protein
MFDYSRISAEVDSILHLASRGQLSDALEKAWRLRGRMIGLPVAAFDAADVLYRDVGDWKAEVERTGDLGHARSFWHVVAESDAGSLVLTVGDINCAAEWDPDVQSY